MVETVLQSFPFQFVFRGVFPGGFFVLSYVVATKGWSGLGDIGLSWLPLAVFVGVIVYILHRSVVYPILECSFDSAKGRRLRKFCPLIRRHTIVRALDMWSTGEHDEPIENIARHLTAWNDYVHLQYSSGWCIIAGAICAWNCKANPSVALIVLVLALFASGFISEWRLRVVARKALRRHPPETLTSNHSAAKSTKND